MRSFLKSQSIDCMACMSMLWLLLTTLRDVSSLGGEFSILAACRSRPCGGKVALIRAVRSSCSSVRPRPVRPCRPSFDASHTESGSGGFNTLRSELNSITTHRCHRPNVGWLRVRCVRTCFFLG